MSRAIFLLLPLLSPAMADAPTNPGPFRKIAILHLKESSSEMIDPSVKASLMRRLEEAKEWGADCIVLEIESYGGMVSSALEIGDEIFVTGRKIHTIAWIPRRAISAAAMMSITCREIVMNEVAMIGDSQSVYFTAEGPVAAPEKTQTVVAEAFDKYARGNGYEPPVCVAMVRPETEVIRYRKPVDPADPARGLEWVYFRSDDTAELPSRFELEDGGYHDREVVVREGELATFGAGKAMEYGLCSRLEPDLEALLASIRAPDAEVRRLDWNWAERSSRWLLGMRWLLFLVGLGALYFSLKMPGTGIPEALAIVCFALFFGASAIAGLAGSLEIILFVVGVLLLVVEIFILPGFGVPGIVGLVLLLTSIGLAAIPEMEYDQAPSYFLVPIAIDLFAGVAGAIVLALILVRFLPKVPLFRGLALVGSPAAGTLTGSAHRESGHDLLGATGVTDSPLRPAGRAVIGGKHVDVMSEGEMIASGVPVVVVATRGNVIVVRATESA